MALFRILTIYNSEPQYRQMVASFAAAGFDGPDCVFEGLSNVGANRHDPWDVLRGLTGTARLAGTADEPYVVFCHQDVRADPSNRMSDLLAIVRAVDAQQPRWAVLGNAGFGLGHELHVWIDAPKESVRTAPAPAMCLSLDENFLVLNRRAVPAVTPGLSGFHLYATDLVLNGLLARRPSYVVPFLVRHLSSGDPTTADFRRARDAFEAAWAGRVALGLVATPCTVVDVSRHRPIRWVIRRARLRRWMAGHRLTFAATLADLLPWRNVGRLASRPPTLPSLASAPTGGTMSVRGRSTADPTG